MKLPADRTPAPLPMLQPPAQADRNEPMKLAPTTRESGHLLRKRSQLSLRRTDVCYLVPPKVH